jgi:predicted nucleic acid-binding protein
VTVLDTSAAVDYLIGAGAAEQVTDILTSEGEVAAPDLIVFEVLAVLRRETLRGSLSPDRAFAALRISRTWRSSFSPACPCVNERGSCGRTSQPPTRCSSLWPSS